MAEATVVGRMPPAFGNWSGLLALIRRAFAYIDGRIDPPSSALALTPAALEQRAEVETVLLAWVDGRLAGCAFLADRGDHFYLGKLAVEPELQGRGVGKALMHAVEAHARAAGKPRIELQTRVELTGNQQAFTSQGYRETARTAHQGFCRPTSITYRKVLA